MLVALLFNLSWLVCSCNDDDDLPQGPTYLAKSKIVISEIAGMPADATFDKIKVEIQGTCWEIISSVEAPYEHGEVTLELPTGFSSDKLQLVDRSGGDMCGYWPGTSSDPDALVASLGDFIAYDGDVKVGRVYLTDWPGEGSAANKSFIYYQYADRPFELTYLAKSTTSFKDAVFKKGWNAFAKVNPSDNDSETVSNITCTTSISGDTQTHWRFESWRY